MPMFNGFIKGQGLSQIPTQFFSELLPLIDDVAELKITLFCMWALQQKEGDYKYLRYAEFAENETLMAGLQLLDEEGDSDAILDHALEKAEARGTLLSAILSANSNEVCYYVINSERGRTFIDQIKAGEWRPMGKDEIEILPPRPTIYKLYEDNMGLITPIIKEALINAEKEYPVEWIEEAIQYAVERNARSWKYISKILDNWKQEGRNRETVRGDRQQDNGYTSDEWADIVKS
jgi:DNA replication protein